MRPSCVAPCWIFSQRTEIGLSSRRVFADLSRAKHDISDTDAQARPRLPSCVAKNDFPPCHDVRHAFPPSLILESLFYS
jgi:hypothetical protein